MILRIDGVSAVALTKAHAQANDLVQTWDSDLVMADAQPAAAPSRDDKVVDPVAVAALVVSIPSAALAVVDLTDRIRKRHRAKELIALAQRLLEHEVTMQVIQGDRAVELSTLTPDELLDHYARVSPEE